MKHVVWCLVAVVVSLGILVGCAGDSSAPTGTSTEIVDAIFTASGVDNFGMKQTLMTNEEKEFLLGSSDYPEFADAVAEVPMINVDTRLLVVIKAADGGDVADIKTQLRENVDPNRLVCVSFSMEDVAIESRGDVILMVIDTDAEQRAALVDAFQSLD